jgi:hypothetical protein
MNSNSTTKSTYLSFNNDKYIGGEEIMRIESLILELTGCNKKEIKQYLESDGVKSYYEHSKQLLRYFKKRDGRIEIIDSTNETTHFVIEFGKSGFYPVIYYNLSDIDSIKNTIYNDNTISDDDKIKELIWYTLYVVSHELAHVPIWILTNKYRKEFYNMFVKDIGYIYTNMGKYFSHKSLKNKSLSYKIWRSTKQVVLNKLLDLDIDDEKDTSFIDFWEIIEDGVMGGIIYMLRKRILEGRTDYNIHILNYIHRLMNNKHDLDYYTDWFIITNEILTDMLIYVTSVEYKLMYERVLPNLYVTLYTKIHNDDSFKELRKLL